MHPDVFARFDQICARRARPGDVLEVGAVPGPETLLALPSLAGHRTRIGINPEHEHDGEGWRIVRGSANDMAMFADASFDTVVSNSTLEHDPRFWRSLAEIRRVLRPGGLFVVGVPGYLPGSVRLDRPDGSSVVDFATPVLATHNFPGDFYRFSVQAMDEVLMEEMDEVEVGSLLLPPRLVASGVRRPTLAPPIVIFNKSHSGSRLLQQVLAEAGVFMGAHLNDSGDSLDWLRLVDHVIEFHYPEFPLQPDPVLESLARAVLDDHLEGFDRRGRWGWKLSETHFALPVIARIFPDAWYVHLIRDGRDVAFSNFNPPITDLLKKTYFGTDRIRHWMGLPLTHEQYNATPHLFNAQLWMRSVEDGRMRGQMLRRYLEVRYEDLVSDFEPTVRRLFRALQIPLDDGFFERWKERVHHASAGKHRSQDRRLQAEVLSLIAAPLAAFGYGDDADVPMPDLTIVYLGEARPLLGFEGVTAADPADGLRRANGRYVLFAVPGVRHAYQGVRLLLRDAARADAIAAVGRLELADALSPFVLHQDGLRHVDAIPVGAALFRRDEALRAFQEGPDWHARLLWRLGNQDLLLFTDRRLGVGSESCPPRMLPPPPLQAPRIAVYGPAGASASLLFDGLPAALHAHLDFVPQLGAGADLPRLQRAATVLVLRDFQRAVEEGIVDALRTAGIPYFYVTDDHYPTLAREMPQNFAWYTEARVAAFLEHAAGAICASPALVEAFRSLTPRTMLWPPVFDPRLLPARLERPEDTLRFGMMGSEVRSGALGDEVLRALALLARGRRVELIARAGMGARGPLVTEVPFESSFRRFVFRWRRFGLSGVLHPAARTANAPYKNPNALLVGAYLGAVPIVSARDPVYAALPDGCGAVRVDGIPAWREAMEGVEPDTERLVEWCREHFSPRPAVEILERIIDEAGSLRHP
jgi:hypothetical protein